MEAILTEWEQRVDQIKNFSRQHTISFGNTPLAVQRFRDLSRFLMLHEPRLREWMMDYLAKNRSEIFKSWWGSRIHSWMKDHLERWHARDLPPNAKEEWNRVFGTTAPFEAAMERADALRATLAISFCDVPEIVAAHEGRDHHYDWDGCVHCEEQEWRWHRILSKRLLDSPHPLLNPALLATLKGDVPSDWEPPHEWGYMDRGMAYDREAYEEHLKKGRTSAWKVGNTPFQKMTALIAEVFRGGAWELPHFYQKTEYHRFMQLWDRLDLIYSTVEMDLPNMVELETYK
jgi:hypothetical protein